MLRRMFKFLQIEVIYTLVKSRTDGISIDFPIAKASSFYPHKIKHITFNSFTIIMTSTNICVSFLAYVFSLYFVIYDAVLPLKQFNVVHLVYLVKKKNIFLLKLIKTGLLYFDQITILLEKTIIVFNLY